MGWKRLPVVLLTRLPMKKVLEKSTTNKVADRNCAYTKIETGGALFGLKAASDVTDNAANKESELEEEAAASK